MVKMINKFLGTPNYEPGTILKIAEGRHCTPESRQLIVLYHTKNKASRNELTIVCTEYPIINPRKFCTYSYNSLRRFYNTSGINKSVAVLYGQIPKK